MFLKILFAIRIIQMIDRNTVAGFERISRFLLHDRGSNLQAKEITLLIITDTNNNGLHVAVYILF